MKRQRERERERDGWREVRGTKITRLASATVAIPSEDIRSQQGLQRRDQY